MIEEQIIWTEFEVRQRLKEYLKDDSLYDCYAAVTSKIKYGYSTGEDGIERRIYRLLKRATLDKAMVDALLPEDGRIKTKKQDEYVQLYHLLRLIYVYDLGIGTTARMLGRPRTTVQKQEKKAIGLLTGYLNSNITKILNTKCG